MDFNIRSSNCFVNKVVILLKRTNKLIHPEPTTFLYRDMTSLSFDCMMHCFSLFSNTTMAPLSRVGSSFLACSAIAVRMPLLSGLMLPRTKSN